MQNRTVRISVLFALSVSLAAGAFAVPLPQTLERVDPKAPCFRWPAVDVDDDGVYDRIDYCPNTPKGCVVDQWGCSSDADGDGVCDQLDRCPGTPRGERVDAQGCAKSQSAAPAAVTPPAPAARPVTPPAPAPRPAPAPPAPKTEVERKLVEGGTVRLENIQFETNSTRLLPESEKSLDEAGAALAKYPNLKVEIGGHSDTRGGAAANQRLSQGRAETVREYLLARFKLDPANLVAKGYGESQPLTKERNADELKENRRVELKVLNPEALPRDVKIEN